MGTTTLLRLATAGSVDDGKSTLVGRLLHDSKNVLVDQFAAVERASAERGLDGADLALLTDGLRAEREQGITIDVAYRYFATAERSFILADCPGHVQYTRNTVTGASTADVVVLLVDVRHGVLEQTRRHLAVAALLHVPHVIVAVNKVDLVDWDEATYRSVEADVQALAAGLGMAQGLHTIPVSALLGDNIVDRSTNTPWYDGPALLELLEQLPSGEPAPTGTFRFPVQTVIRPQSGAVDPQHVEYRGYAGQVAAGTIAVGDAVTVLPSGRTSTVVGIDLAWTELDSAHAGQSVTVRLADDIDIARGDVLVSSHDAPQPVREIEAVVTWLSERPLTPGARYDVKHLTTTVKGIVSEVNGRLDLHELAPAPATSLELNDIGRVRIKLAAPLATEDYATSRRTGAFLLIDAHDGATVAAGMIRDRFDGTLR